MPTARLLPVGLLALGLSACAASTASLPTPSPEEIPDLAAAVAADPGDSESVLLLATAYRQSDRAADAQAVVDAGLSANPAEPGLSVLAGVLAEERGDYAAATGHFESFLFGAPAGDVRDEVEARLELARRAQLEADARDALARESELAQVEPDPSAVGVFPFRYDGDDPTWEPLSLALAELLVTDLGITGRLRVLERAKVHALTRELDLAEAGLVEPSTAARSGRLLGSGHVIQGRFRVDESERLAVDAAVVRVGRPGAESVEPVRAEDAIDRLFDLEKRMALDIHAELGIDLTPAERALVNERQTESVQALLAWGEGLAASDAGDFILAEERFSAAAELDPGFAVARAHRASVARAAATLASLGGLAGRAGRLALQRQAVQALRNAPAGMRQQVLRNLGRQKRAVLAEVLGQDRVGTAILLELVFRRPGGQP